MKKTLQSKVVLFLFFLVIAPLTLLAVNATKESPVLFLIRGSVTGGVIQYNVVVQDVYVQTYQSWTITYPSELAIQNTSALAGIWNISNQTSPDGTTISTSFMIKSGTQTYLQMKPTIEKIYFTLAITSVFPPNHSKISISAYPTKVTFFQDAEGYAHWYEFVPFSSGNQTWMVSYNNAKLRTMQDPRYPTDPSRVLNGYLATITSEAEQMQIYSAIATQCGWLGGTRMLFNDGNAKIQDEATISTGIGSFNTGSGATAGYLWYWACGPEAWTTYDAGEGTYQYYPKYTPGASPLVFFDRPNYGSGGRSPLGVYNNFNNSNAHDPNKDINPVNMTNNFDHFFNVDAEYVGKLTATGSEPNNSGTEYCLQFAARSGNKTLVIPPGQPNAGTYTNTNPDTWNDINLNPGSSVLGYYVEFGGYPGDPKIEELGSSDVTTSSEVELVLPVLVQYRSTVKTISDNYQVISEIKKNYDRALNYEQYLPFTAYRNVGGLPGAITGYTAYGYDFIGEQEDNVNLTVNAAGDVSGFFSPFTQRILFLYKPNNVTVFFDANFEGATAADVSTTEKTISYDSPYGELAITTRKGHEFGGWLTGKVVGTIVEPDTLVKSLSNHTLYAQWYAKNGYSVKYDVNGATGAIPDKIYVSWDEPYLLPAEPTRAGYLFMGWNVSVNGSKQGVTNTDIYGDLAFSDITGFITLQAQWITDTVQRVVVYHTNGATTPVSIPNDTLHNSTEPIPMPAPAKTGYSFGGWYVENDGLGGFLSGPFGVGTDITFSDLYPSTFVILGAIWTPKTYTVKYNLNDGTSVFGTPRTGVLWEQTGIAPAPDGAPFRPAFLFTGWNTLPDRTGKHVYSGDTYATIVQHNDTQHEITLYAQWIEERTYFVRYDLNGASTPAVIPDKTGVLMADDHLLPATNPSPPVGFEFAGWAVSFNGVKQSVTIADKFSELAINPNEGYIILKAQWYPKANLTVNYNVNGGNWGSATPPVSKTGVVWIQTYLLPMVEPERTGYVFAGWNTQPDGSGVIATNSSTFCSLVNNNDTETSVTLYAQWTSNTVYTVRYNVGIGSGNVPNAPLNATTDLIPNPTPTAPPGYQFLHWRVEDNGYGQGTTMTVNETTTFQELAYPGVNYIVLIAEYIVKNSYTVIYHHNLPDTLIMDTLEHVKWAGQTNLVPCPFPVSRPGYSLLGWTTLQDGTGITVLPAFIYSTLVGGIETPYVILYAQWEKGSFSVRYDLNGGIPPKPEDYTMRTVGLDDANLLPPSFARAGYLLNQWNISENGFNLNVQPTDRYRDLANPGAQYITIKAQWGEKEYQVHYDENGSTDTYLPQTGVRWWSHIEYPAVAPTPPFGYASFLGWKLSAVGTTEKTPAEIAVSPILNGLIEFGALAVTDEITTTSITLQAQYKEAPDVTVNYWVRTKNSTLHNSGGTINRSSETLPPATGVAAGSIASPNPGYHFVGWFAVEDTISYTTIITTDFEYIPQKIGGLYVDTTYVALFEENSNVTITYAPKTVGAPDTQGGNVSPASESVTPATGNPSATAIPNHGYHLVGWFYATDVGFTDTLAKTLNFNPPRNTDGIFVNSAYIALFEENDSVVITYIPHNLNILDPSDGGILSKDEQSVAPATGVVTGSIATPYTGYNFVGWFLSGANYNDLNDTLTTAFQYVPQKNIYNIFETATYVAVFAENDSVTITYAPITLNGTPTQGGSVAPTSEKVAPASGVAAGSTATPIAGYHLVGWFYATDLSYTTNLGTSLSFNPPKIDGLNVDSSYVAVFAENDSVTIYYSALTTHGLPPTQGGTVAPASEKVAPATGSASGTATPNPGYYFVGWFYATDLSFADTLSKLLTFMPPRVSGLHVDSSYVALFTPKSGYIVVYDSDGGTPIASKTVNWAENVLPTTNPTKPDYILIGWEVVAGGPSATLGTSGNYPYGTLATNVATDTIMLKALWCVTTPPVIAFTNNGIICSGASVTLSVSNMAIYSSSRYFEWYEFPSNTLVHTGDTYVTSKPGTYYALVVDGSCSVASTNSVIGVGTAPALPVLDVTNGGYICNNENVVLSVTNTADYSPYATYKWYETTAPATTLGTNTYLNVGKAGNYNVTIWDDYCTATANAPVVVHKNPPLPVPNIVASNGGYLEPGGSLTLSVANKTDYSGSETYEWFEEQDPTTILSTTDALTISTTGVYYVIIIDFYCTTQNTFKVCPRWVADFEGVHYSITSLAGLCWTSNMATRYYADGEPISFARAYYSPISPDTITNANTFGLLYTWYSTVRLPEENVRADAPWGGYVQGICPLGWHIPTQQEWESLLQYNIQDLKSENYWIDLPGSDKYVFTSLPAGLYMHTTESFIHLYGETAYWSCGVGPNDATPYAAGITYFCNLIMDKRESKSDGYTVRCVMDY